MNEAERTPSPNKFCKIFGIRNPALKASAVAEFPRKCAKMLSRTSPAIRLSNTPTAIVPARLAQDPPGAGDVARVDAPSSPRASRLGAISDKVPLAKEV